MTHKYFPTSFKLTKSIIQYIIDEFCLIFEEITKKITFFERICSFIVKKK